MFTAPSKASKNPLLAQWATSGGDHRLLWLPRANPCHYKPNIFRQLHQYQEHPMTQQPAHNFFLLEVYSFSCQYVSSQILELPWSSACDFTFIFLISSFLQTFAQLFFTDRQFHQQSEPSLYSLVGAELSLESLEDEQPGPGGWKSSKEEDAVPIVALSHLPIYSIPCLKHLASDTSHS